MLTKLILCKLGSISWSPLYHHMCVWQMSAASFMLRQQQQPESEKAREARSGARDQKTSASQSHVEPEQNDRTKAENTA